MNHDLSRSPIEWPWSEATVGMAGRYLGTAVALQCTVLCCTVPVACKLTGYGKSPSTGNRSRTEEISSPIRPSQKEIPLCILSSWEQLPYNPLSSHSTSFQSSPESRNPRVAVIMDASCKETARNGNVQGNVDDGKSQKMEISGGGAAAAASPRDNESKPAVNPWKLDLSKCSGCGERWECTNASWQKS